MSEHEKDDDQLLVEMEQREALENRARELGVKFHPNVGDDTLRQRIAEAESGSDEGEPRESGPQAAKQAGGTTITNPTRMVQRMGMIVMAPGATHAVSERESADDRTMAKVRNAIKLGLVHEA